jgi:hypothetical protein
MKVVVESFFSFVYRSHIMGKKFNGCNAGAECNDNGLGVRGAFVFMV